MYSFGWCAAKFGGSMRRKTEGFVWHSTFIDWIPYYLHRLTVDRIIAKRDRPNVIVNCTFTPLGSCNSSPGKLYYPTILYPRQFQSRLRSPTKKAFTQNLNRSRFVSFVIKMCTFHSLGAANGTTLCTFHNLGAANGTTFLR